MDRHSAKRARESSSASGGFADAARCERSNSPPPEVAGVGEKKQHLDGGEETAGRSVSFGVFDFPWLKDGLISQSEEWRFEDVFCAPLKGNGTSSTAGAEDALAIGTAFAAELEGQLVWCDEGPLPDPWEEEYEAEAEAREAALDGGGAEGMDCIWRSLLNQPLRQGSSGL